MGYISIIAWKERLNREKNWEWLRWMCGSSLSV
jgi:hypothetical protein